MSLKKTEDQLYDPKSNIEERKHSKSVFNAEVNAIDFGDDQRFIDEKSSWDRRGLFGFDRRAKRVMLWGAGVVLILLAAAVVVVAIEKFKKTAFAEDKVSVMIEGRTSAKSAETTVFVIKYENNNRTALKNVEIILNHSENFYPEESEQLKRYNDRNSRIAIGKINAYTRGEVEIKGKFYAAENYTVYLRPTLKYQPNNFNSDFEVSSQLGINISTSPIELEIDSPKEALADSTIEYIIKYRNKGDIPFNNLSLKLEYADGFIFQNANPFPVDNNDSWYLGDISAGEEGSIMVQGRVQGSQFDVKSIRAEVYKNENNKTIVYGKAEKVTKITVPPLAITHKIDGKNMLNINLGDVLKYEIKYANKGEVNLRDVIIKLKVDSPIINYKELLLDNGAYEEASKTITWKASDIPDLKNLEPGSQGTIELELPLKERLEIEKFEDKDFIIESLVTIDSSDIVHHSLGMSKNASNKVIAKLNSKVILETEIYRVDDAMNKIELTPLEVGEEVKYAVYWRISNISSDISEVKVKAFLPTYIKWDDVVVPEKENIVFNERTHEVVWDVGRVVSATGVLSPVREVGFQIGFSPEVNQMKRAVETIYKSTLTGVDDFTGESILQDTFGRNTDLRKISSF